MKKESVAVIGSGIAGLTAAYLLQRRYDVTLYESAERLGGHTHTHDVVTPDAGIVPIDSGFIVHNQCTYPLLCQLFSELGVETRPTEMSMSVHCHGCGLEYAGAKGLRGVFSQPRTLHNVAYLRLLSQVPRFYRDARQVVERGSDDMSLGEFLKNGGLLGLLHFALRGADRVVRVVGRAGSGTGVPGSLPLRVPPESWDAVPLGIADVAYRRGRFSNVRRPDCEEFEHGGNVDSGALGRRRYRRRHGHDR